jgi:hypothetical protein
MTLQALMKHSPTAFLFFFWQDMNLNIAYEEALQMLFIENSFYISLNVTLISASFINKALANLATELLQRSHLIFRSNAS